MKSSKKSIIFKPYDPSQQLLLPPSLGELIPQEHPVRVVNEVIEKIDLDLLSEQYKGGGASSYHPRMLLKIFMVICPISIRAVSWKQQHRKAFT